MLVFTSVILTYPSVAFPWRFGVLDSTCSGRTCVLSDCMAALAVPEEEVSPGSASVYAIIAVLVISVRKFHGSVSTP